MPSWYGGSTLNPDELIPKENQWIAQWYRVTRWFRRCEELKEKSKTNELDADDIDTVIAFFQNCYHLRDWIGASRANLKEKLNALSFRSTVEMKVCRDICNGFKHKALDQKKYPPLDPDFNVYCEYDHFLAEADSSANPVLYRIAFSYKGDIRKYDLFDLVERCYRIWENFITQEIGNISPQNSE